MLLSSSQDSKKKGVLNQCEPETRYIFSVNIHYTLVNISYGL